MNPNNLFNLNTGALDAVGTFAATLKHFDPVTVEFALQKARRLEDVPWLAAYHAIKPDGHASASYALGQGTPAQHLFFQHAVARLQEAIHDNVAQYRVHGTRQVPTFNSGDLKRAFTTSASPQDQTMLSRLAETSQGKHAVENAWRVMGCPTLSAHNAHFVAALALLSTPELAGSHGVEEAAKVVRSMKSVLDEPQKMIEHLLLSKALEGIPHPLSAEDLIGRMVPAGQSNRAAVYDAASGISVAEKIKVAVAQAKAKEEFRRQECYKQKADAAQARRQVAQKKKEKTAKRLGSIRKKHNK